MNDILSHAEVQQLLLRNTAQPQLGVPEYKGWSDPTIRPLSQSQLDESNRKANLGPALSFISWEKKLNSKRWRFNKGKESRYCMRVVRVRSKDTWITTEVELNARIR